MVGSPRILAFSLLSTSAGVVTALLSPKKAAVVSNCILQSLIHKSVSHFALAFKVYCRSILEHCSSVWFPIRSVRPVENVLRHFTRIAFIKISGSIAVPSYETRLSIFGLEYVERP